MLRQFNNLWNCPLAPKVNYNSIPRLKHVSVVTEHFFLQLLYKIYNKMLHIVFHFICKLRVFNRSSWQMINGQVLHKNILRWNFISLIYSRLVSSFSASPHLSSTIIITSPHYDNHNHSSTEVLVVFFPLLSLIRQRTSLTSRRWSLLFPNVKVLPENLQRSSS